MDEIVKAQTTQQRVSAVRDVEEHHIFGDAGTGKQGKGQGVLWQVRMMGGWWGPTEAAGGCEQSGEHHTEVGGIVFL